ncbi:hypothetical protein G5C01_06465 [Moraxella bovoculi]|uniref:hypothetical protein n=1 Tax=Moraxella bovoculi TaxID=386891 RepID=UPI001570BD9C|nr:hypothetical protein [Moraxella bovoculi]NSM10998.1 hypothetical protein [Moraxella bovoculi]
MGLYAIKEYLNIQDVADYLDDMGIFAVNWNNSDDCWRFSDILSQLAEKGKLTPLIKLVYERPVNIIHYSKSIDDIDDITDENEVQIISEKSAEVDGFCRLHKVCFERVLENNHPKYRYQHKKEIVYFYLPYGEVLDNNCQIEFVEDYTPIIHITNVLFPKSEIIAIFGNSPYNETVPRLIHAEKQVQAHAQTISELQNRIAELESQSVIPATNSKREQQGNSLLILGAVLDCLDSETIRNYNQTALITTVIEKHGNITGISQSTLTKKFAEAKKYFSQHQ